MSNSETEFVRSEAAMRRAVTISLDEYDLLKDDSFQLRAILATLERIATVTERGCVQFADYGGEMEAVLRAINPFMVESMIRSAREEAAGNE